MWTDHKRHLSQQIYSRREIMIYKVEFCFNISISLRGSRMQFGYDRTHTSRSS